MHEISRRVVAAAATALVAAVGLVSMTAAAAPVAAEVVKLSAAEAWQLQQRVDQQLANSVGGKQIGPNTIAYYDGSVLVNLVIPGETYARRVNADFEVQASLCGYEYACIYDNTNFAGDNALRRAEAACSTYDYACADPINKFDLDGKRCSDGFKRLCQEASRTKKAVQASTCSTKSSRVIVGRRSPRDARQEFLAQAAHAWPNYEQHRCVSFCDVG